MYMYIYRCVVVLKKIEEASGRLRVSLTLWLVSVLTKRRKQPVFTSILPVHFSSSVSYFCFLPCFLACSEASNALVSCNEKSRSFFVCSSKVLRAGHAARIRQYIVHLRKLYNTRMNLQKEMLTAYCGEDVVVGDDIGLLTSADHRSPSLPEEH
jgi:hypothetical protein